MPEFPGALCRAHDARLWWPRDATERDGRRGDVDLIRESEAKTICARCPVRIECGTWAIEHNEHGIWGGLTDEQRRQIRAQITQIGESA